MQFALDCKPYIYSSLHCQNNKQVLLVAFITIYRLDFSILYKNSWQVLLVVFIAMAELTGISRSNPYEHFTFHQVSVVTTVTNNTPKGKEEKRKINVTNI